MNKAQLIWIVDHFDFLEILNMSREDLAERFGSKFAAMKGYKQNNPHHCYDLLEHTLRTVDAIDCQNISEDQACELRIAALYHDIGKPSVAAEKDGRTVFYGHAAESEKIARDILSQIGFGGEGLERICFYIMHHDDFISFKLREEIVGVDNPHIKPITEQSVAEKIASVKRKSAQEKGHIPSFKDYSLLLRLCIADAKSQNDVSILNGAIVDTKEFKLKRLGAISEIINWQTD